MNYSGYFIDKNNNKYYAGVVESGSNENGNYIKFADGTMICTNNSVVCGEKVYSITTDYAEKFINKPTIVVTNRYNISRNIIWSIGNITNENFNLYPLENGDKPTVEVSVAYIAIGKWK